MTKPITAEPETDNAENKGEDRVVEIRQSNEARVGRGKDKRDREKSSNGNWNFLPLPPLIITGTFRRICKLTEGNRA